MFSSCGKPSPTGDLDKDLKTYGKLLEEGREREAEEFREEAVEKDARRIKGLE